MVTGTQTISGNVFADDGGTNGTVADGLMSGGEAGISSVAVTLYVDVDLDGIVDETDLQIATADSAADGSYSFANLPDGSFLVVVDPTDTNLPTSWGMTTSQARAVVIVRIGDRRHQLRLRSRRRRHQDADWFQPGRRGCDHQLQHRGLEPARRGRSHRPVLAIV